MNLLWPADLAGLSGSQNWYAPSTLHANQHYYHYTARGSLRENRAIAAVHHRTPRSVVAASEGCREPNRHVIAQTVPGIQTPVGNTPATYRSPTPNDQMMIAIAGGSMWVRPWA